MASEIKLESLMEKIEDGPYFRLDGTLEEWMNKSKLRKLRVLPDGHCLLHAIIEVLKCNEGMTLTSGELVDELRNELLGHYDDYQAFSQDGVNPDLDFEKESAREYFVTQLEAYIVKTEYNGDIVDLLVQALCNAVGMIVLVLEDREGMGPTMVINSPWKEKRQSPNYLIHLLRSGHSRGREHYDALLPTTPKSTRFSYNTVEIEKLLTQLGIHENSEIGDISKGLEKLATLDIGMTYSVHAYFTRKQNAWKTITIDIAVVGASGAGKSAFVNAIRGAKPRDKHASREGSTECTLEPRKYTFPGNRNISMWDMPGLDTKNFSREEYFKIFNIDRYDAFVLVSSERFDNGDAMIAKQILAKKKPFYFVRTKIHFEVDNEIENYRKSEREARALKFLDEIRQKMEADLKSLGAEVPVYLIDNRKHGAYDLGKLKEAIANHLPELQRQTLIMSLDAVGKDVGVINGKVSVMNSARKYTAAWNALSFLGSPVFRQEQQAIAMLKKVLEYQKQLGLDDESFRAKARKLDEEHAGEVEKKLKEKRREYINHDLNLAYFSGVLISGEISGTTKVELGKMSILVSYKNMSRCLEHSLSELEKAAAAISVYCSGLG